MSPDAERLEDMLREAQLAVAFVEGMSEADFALDEKTQHAVVRCLEVIGEAANGVSLVTREKLQSIPWTEIIGQRHIAIHHYRKIQMPRIWKTVTSDLPPLMKTLAEHLAQNFLP